ncbi:hypothetical protein HAX54_012815 [Datura stramonium]|uniref:Putative plant transposon protein domain-containing protein n=1 Tax=Datura stramonium TaxID=4076 RepID=A0ABS8TMC7_DATST|nr:hypothetical protein [Datura stramonium]
MRNDSPVDRSSSSSDSSNSNEGSDNETTSSLAGDSEPIRGDVIKGKTPGFRDNLHWQVKGADTYYQEGLTTTTRGYFKCNITEEVRIIDSEIPEYLDIEDRVVLVASLMFGFPLNIGALIVEEMHWRAVRLSTSFPFPCLITRLCNEAHVPILAGVDVETYATKKYGLDKSRDESRYDLKLHKPEVFGASGQTARATEPTTNQDGETIREDYFTMLSRLIYDLGQNSMPE